MENKTLTKIVVIEGVEIELTPSQIETLNKADLKKRIHRFLSKDFSEFTVITNL